VIELERGLSIRGRVLDTEGAPIAGARVVASGRLAEELKGLDPVGASFGPKAVPQFAEAESDAMGGFRLDGLSPGAFLVTADHQHYLMHDAPSRVVRLRRGYPVRDLKLELAPLLGLHAIAVDSETGQGISAAGYTVATSGDESKNQVRSDEVLARELGTKLGQEHANELAYPGVRYYILPRGERRAPPRVELRIAAPGYIPAQQEMELRPTSELAEPVRIPLDRESAIDLVPLYLRAERTGEAGFTGDLVLKLLPHGKAGRHKIYLPLSFVEGRAAAPIPVPVGTHRLSVLPAWRSASLAFLRLPAGKPVDLVVDPGTRAEFTLRIGGFELVVLARDAATHADLRHFTLATLRGTRLTGSVSTWSTEVVDRPPGSPGVRFWFSESEIELEIGKPGYAPVRRSFQLESGVREVWSVDLAPE